MAWWGGMADVDCADLILNGVLERFPDLRLGIVELSSLWVPLYLMMLDGGSAFTRLSSTELANVSSGGGMVPTFIISKR